MKYELKRNYRSRLNQLITHLQDANDIASRQCNEFTTDNMKELRDHINSISQCFHEYSAYHNTYIKFLGGDNDTDDQ